MLKKIVARLIGKKLDANLEKWGVSKTKIIAIIGVAIYAIETLSPHFGTAVKIPDDVYALLGTLGLWTLKDGQDDVISATKKQEAPKNETPQ